MLQFWKALQVSGPLPALEEELRHRRGDAAGEERLQALLADSRRTLARLLAVADKLAPVAVAQDIVASALCESRALTT